MKLKAFLLIVTLHFAVLASCAKGTPEAPAPPRPGEEGYKTIDLRGYRLLFSDEFDGRKMNWDIWASENPNNIKHETSRGPEAVEVRDGADRRIGYVSCECNEFVARLIDGGKSVEGRLTDKEQIGSWTRLVMEVVLND